MNIKNQKETILILFKDQIIKFKKSSTVAQKSLNESKSLLIYGEMHTQRWTNNYKNGRGWTNREKDRDFKHAK